MSCNVSDTISWIRSQLKDNNNNSKYQRWDDEYLNGAIELAVSAIYSLRADLFSQEKRIKLDAGCHTNICKSGCSRLLEPFYLEGNECQEIETIDEDKTWFLDGWIDYDCDILDDDNEYVIESIKTYPSSRCKITITPPVPDDGKVRYLIAQCVPTPDALDDLLDGGVLPDFVCENRLAFIELILYICYDRDTMINPSGASEAQLHFNNFITMINQKILVDRSLALEDEELLRILGTTRSFT